MDLQMIQSCCHMHLVKIHYSDEGFSVLIVIFVMENWKGYSKWASRFRESFHLHLLWQCSSPRQKHCNRWYCLPRVSACQKGFLKSQSSLPFPLLPRKTNSNLYIVFITLPPFPPNMLSSRRCSYSAFFHSFNDYRYQFFRSICLWLQ